MPKKKKKKGKKKFDKKAIAKQTKGQVKDSSERKGISGGGIFKQGVKFTKYSPVADEDHTLDIVPFQAGKKMPVDMKSGEPMVKKGNWAYTYEFWSHRGIGPLENETVICPERTYKAPCPICEHRKELVAEKAFDSKKMTELLCKQRNLYNIVCYDTDKEEEKGVQLMDVSHFYFEKHISKLASKAVRRKKGSKVKKADPFKNFADPTDDGVSIEFSIEGAKTKNDFDSWLGHQLTEREYDLDDEVLEAALQLDQIVEILSYEELYKLYYDEDYEGDDEKGYEDEEEEEEDEEEEDDDDSSDEEDEDEEEDEEEDEDEEEKLRRKKRKKKKGKKSKSKKGKKRKKKKVECPEGGTFGEDFSEFDDCDDCEHWDACELKSNEDDDDDDD